MKPEQNLKKIRELKNYTQEYVSERLGISQVAYCRLESGKTRLTIKRIHELAEIFEIDPLLLLTFDENAAIGNGHNFIALRNPNVNEKDKIAAFETRISSLESHVLKILDQQHKKETGG